MPPLETLEKASLIGMPVELIVDTADKTHHPITEAQLHAWLSAVGDISDDARIARDICVRLCDEEESRTLNRTYRGKDAPTNILSFPAEVDIPDPPLGDLAMCWSVIKREAAAQHKSLHDHCAHLFIHGVLHLLGYDHVEAAQACEMEGLEIAVLARLGIANPYE